jgi:hypothetical protein
MGHLDDVVLYSPEKVNQVNITSMTKDEERLKLQQYEHYRFRLFLGSNIFCFLSGMYLHYLFNQ